MILQDKLATIQRRKAVLEGRVDASQREQLRTVARQAEKRLGARASLGAGGSSGSGPAVHVDAPWHANRAQECV